MRTKLILIALGVFALDRVVKMWTLANFALGEARPLIPGVIQLRYVRNTGVAFSFLADHQWILMLIIPLMLIGLGIALAKGVFPCPVQKIALVAVMAGGFGNLLDRILYGHVVDMFEFLFMNFAVFNVADIFITIGAPVLFIAYVLGEWRKEKAIASPGAEEEAHDE